MSHADATMYFYFNFQFNAFMKYLFIKYIMLYSIHKANDNESVCQSHTTTARLSCMLYIKFAFSPQIFLNTFILFL